MRTIVSATSLMIASFLSQNSLFGNQAMYITLCNAAGLPEKTLMHARTEVEIIFQSAGAQVSWIECENVTAAKAELGERLFVIRLLNRVPSFITRNVSLETMGRAYTNERGSGFLADAYVPSINKFADLAQVEKDALLGVVVSHELRHLLLGPGHVPQGIMYGKWNGREVQAIRKRWLRFEKEQSPVIQNELEKRAQTLIDLPEEKP